MGTYTLDQYQMLWRKRAKEIKRAAARSAKDAAMFMSRTARGMAPFNKGGLRNGISNPISKGNNVYEVSSAVPGDFPYNVWVDQRGDYRTLHFKEKGGWIPPSKSRTGDWVRAFPPNSDVVYGVNSMNTGTPRFWHLATLRTYGLFGKITRLNIGKALRVSV